MGFINKQLDVNTHHNNGESCSTWI